MLIFVPPHYICVKLFFPVSGVNSGDFSSLSVVSIRAAVCASANIDPFDPTFNACDPLQVHFPEVEKVDWVNKVGY